MERVKIVLPKKIIYTTEISVLIQHINYGNHVGNDSIVSLLHEARLRFLTHFGYSELNIEGVGIIMADLAVQYQSQLYYGDVLKATLYIGDTTPTSFSLYYKLEVINKNNQQAVLARTNILCFDYANSRIVKIPTAFLAKMCIDEA